MVDKEVIKEALLEVLNKPSTFSTASITAASQAEEAIGERKEARKQQSSAQKAGKTHTQTNNKKTEVSNLGGD